MKKTYIISFILVAIVVLTTLFYLVYKKPIETNQPKQVLCTMEIKVCPDGSSVGRISPTCEFAECPAPPATNGEAQNEIETTIANLNQRIFSNGIYITPLEVKSDSRCAVDVKCIWAGTVTLRVKLESGGISSEKTLTLGVPTYFAAKQIVLEEVIPVQQSQKRILSEDYQFEFLVTDIDSKG